LLPFVPDWRWLLDREDSPWYPTARLFRQGETRQWDNVIARVQAALRDYVRSCEITSRRTFDTGQLHPTEEYVGSKPQQIAD
jgi:hypothetical protein